MEQETARPDSTGMRQPAVLVWLRLARVYAQVERELTEQLRQWGLSLAQFDVLAQVGAMEGCTQQEVANRLLVTKGNITQLLDRLEQRGIIVRRPDGRANRLYLTDAGRCLHDEVVPAHQAPIAACLAALSADEQQELLRLLRTLDRSLA